MSYVFALEEYVYNQNSFDSGWPYLNGMVHRPTDSSLPLESMVGLWQYATKWNGVVEGDVPEPTVFDIPFWPVTVPTPILPQSPIIPAPIVNWGPTHLICMVGGECVDKGWREVENHHQLILDEPLMGPTPEPVPESSTMALLILGFLLILVARKFQWLIKG